METHHSPLSILLDPEGEEKTEHGGMEEKD